jgi:hypothetical protein
MDCETGNRSHFATDVHKSEIKNGYLPMCRKYFLSSQTAIRVKGNSHGASLSLPPFGVCWPVHVTYLSFSYLYRSLRWY